VSGLDLLLNGEPCTLAAGSTIADLVAHLTGDPARTGIAVAVDRTVIPRSEWDRTPARAGSQVEVVTAAAGG
jgi:sulfur carrier protein